MSNRVGDNLMHFGANEELVRALTCAGVKFVVIGGLAVAWHCSERQADDMDLLVEPTAENSARITQALQGLRLTGFEPNAFAKLGLQVPLKHMHYAELLTPQKGDPAFSETEALAVDASLFGVPVRLASVQTLIAMKEHAAASANAQLQKHLKDIELLRQHAASQETPPSS